MNWLKYPATLIAIIIVGIAIILAWGCGFIPQGERELEFSDLFFREGIAYAVSPDSLTRIVP